MDERCLKPKPWPFTTSYELVLAESSRWCLVVQAVVMFKRCWIEVKKRIFAIFNWFYCKINGPYIIYDLSNWHESDFDIGARMICNPMVNYILVELHLSCYTLAMLRSSGTAVCSLCISQCKNGEIPRWLWNIFETPRKILMDGIASTMSYVLFNTRVLKMNMVLCACGFVVVLWWRLFWVEMTKRESWHG